MGDIVMGEGKIVEIDAGIDGTLKDNQHNRCTYSSNRLGTLNTVTGDKAKQHHLL